MTATLEAPSQRPPGPPERRRMTRRRKVRLWLTWAFIPIAIVMVVVAFKLISVPPAGADAVAQFDEGDYQSSARTSTALLGWNLVEPYKAYFNRGDAYATAGHYIESVDDFERALALAPTDKKCDVSVNLSLSWERIGDDYYKAGLYSGAQKMYQTAKAVITAAGEGCQPPNAPKNEEENRDPGQELKDAGTRLDQKLQQAGGAASATQDPNAPGSESGKLGELGQQDQQSDKSKADQDSRDRSGQGSTSTDKPW